jgi:hypothetical protein
MLYPKEDPDRRTLMFACRTCQFSEPAKSSCVFVNKMNNTAGDTAGVTQDVGSDPTVGPPYLCILCGDCVCCEFCDEVYCPDFLEETDLQGAVRERYSTDVVEVDVDVAEDTKIQESFANSASDISATEIKPRMS